MSHCGSAESEFYGAVSSSGITCCVMLCSHDAAGKATKVLHVCKTSSCFVGLGGL